MNKYKEDLHHCQKEVYTNPNEATSATPALTYAKCLNILFTANFTQTWST